MLPSLRLISSKQTVSSNQCLCRYTGLKVIVVQDKTPKRGCRSPAVNNLIDGVPGVPVEGTSTLAVSRVLMATAVRMFYAGLDVPVQ